MEFIPVENTVEINVRFLLHTQQCENVLSFTRNEGEVNPDNMKTLAQALSAYWIANFIPYQSYQASLREIYVVDLNTDTSPTYTETAGLPVAGGNLGDAAPGGTTLCYSFRTAARGRSGRGRNYFIGIPKPQLVGNAVISTYADDVLSGYAGLVGPDSLAPGWTWCVVSRFLNGSPRTAGVVREIQAATLVNTYVDSQRRRLEGRGQ